MKGNTLWWLVGAGAAYYFLTSRQPVFVQAADGTLQPAGVLDKLTVQLTGAQPPQPAKATVSVPGFVDLSYTA